LPRREWDVSLICQPTSSSFFHFFSHLHQCGRSPHVTSGASSSPRYLTLTIGEQTSPAAAPYVPRSTKRPVSAPTGGRAFPSPLRPLQNLFNFYASLCLRPSASSPDLSANRLFPSPFPRIPFKSLRPTGPTSRARSDNSRPIFLPIYGSISPQTRPVYFRARSSPPQRVGRPRLEQRACRTGWSAKARP